MNCESLCCFIVPVYEGGVGTLEFAVDIVIRHPLIRQAANDAAVIKKAGVILVGVDDGIPPELCGKNIFKHDSDAAASIELVALRAHAPEKKPAGANAEGEKPDDAVPKKAGKRGDRPPRASRKPQRERKREERVYLDRISKQAALLQQHYRLSERETEVMELIARGNTVARIAEDLVVTENTIRTHSKRIYAKLDIHKKQELLDLIESFDPNDLQE